MSIEYNPELGCGWTCPSCGLTCGADFGYDDKQPHNHADCDPDD